MSAVTNEPETEGSLVTHMIAATPQMGAMGWGWAGGNVNAPDVPSVV